MNNRALRIILRHMSPAAAAAVGVFLITAVALLVPPYIGMADNGDYFRILYSNGIYFNDPDYNSQYLGYFVKQYGIYQYYNENGATLFSSQSIFISLSLFLNRLLFDSQVFDIRFQAVLYIVLYTAAIYLLVEAVTWKASTKAGYIIAAIAVFVFGDTGYTAYFNSFYSESVVLIMTMLMLASGILLYRKRYNDYVTIALFAVSTILLTTSKQQNAPVGILAAVIGGAFILYIRSKRTYRAVVATALVAMIAAGIGTYVLIPKEFVNINKYHAMTRGVLMNAQNPEKTLESFGIDKQYAILNQSLYYDPYATVDVDSQLLQDSFYDKYGFGSILAYYIAHPDQAGGMLNLAARDGFAIRPKAMGNYERQTGKPFGAQTVFFSGYSLLKDAFAPKTFGFIILWMLITVGMYAPSFISAIKSRMFRLAFRLPLMVMLMLMGLSGIVVSIIGAGDADLAKHEFLFTLSFDLVTFVLVGDLLARRLWNNQADAAAASLDE